MSQEDQESKSELLRLLSHPIRRSVVEALGTGESSVGVLAERLGVMPSHLSQQLAILRRSGLVRSRRAGSTVFYSLLDHRLLMLLDVVETIVTSSDAGDPRRTSR